MTQFAKQLDAHVKSLGMASNTTVASKTEFTVIIVKTINLAYFDGLKYPKL